MRHMRDATQRSRDEPALETCDLRRADRVQSDERGSSRLVRSCGVRSAALKRNGRKKPPLVLLGAAVLCLASPARAEAPGPKPLTYTPWPLFDPYLSRQGLVLRTQLVRYWTLRSEERTTGVGLGLGQSSSTERGPLHITARVEWGVRFVPGEIVEAHLGRYSYGAGFHIGPLFPEVYVGMSVVNVDVSGGQWHFGMFSPHVGAGLAVLLGNVRVSAHVYSEYLWRWGSRDGHFEGIVLDLALDRPPRGIPERYLRHPRQEH